MGTALKTWGEYMNFRTVLNFITPHDTPSGFNH
jgi:hypothetical protein